jgi:hypothetical protein
MAPKIIGRTEMVIDLRNVCCRLEQQLAEITRIVFASKDGRRGKTNVTSRRRNDEKDTDPT